MNGGGRFAVELLVDDALDEGFEGGLGAGELKGEGAGALDEASEFGIGGGELAEGGGVVVAGGAGTVDGARHVLHATTLSWKMSGRVRDGCGGKLGEVNKTESVHIYKVDAAGGMSIDSVKTYI